MQPMPDPFAATRAFAFFYFLFMGGMCFFGILLLGFWIWMIVDCIANEPPSGDKIVWVLIVIFLNWIGATIYFFARRRNRNKGQFFKLESPPPIR